MREIKFEIAEAERKAWISLACYKFVMFGYWAGVWVHLNRVSGLKYHNPFTDLVRIARDRPHEFEPDMTPNPTHDMFYKGSQKRFYSGR